MAANKEYNVEPILTIADLAALPDDDICYELVEGELLMSRAPSLNHQRIIGRLSHKIQIYLDENSLGEVLVGPGVILSELDGVIPDLVYISSERLAKISVGDRLEGAPELVIEVLSPGSENEQRDRKIKLQLYGKYQIDEYWIVDPTTRTLDIFRLITENDKIYLKHAATLSGDDEITTMLLPDFRCAVAEIFKNIV